MDTIIKNREFEGNVKVTISDNEVRLWVCKKGVSIFRFKAIGQVFSGENDVIIIQGKV